MKLPSGWRLEKLSDICLKITDGSHNPPKGVTSSNYLMLSSKNVFDDHITLLNPRFLSESDFQQEDKRTNIVCGDVLLTIVGTVGRVAVVPSNLPKFTVQRSVAVLKPNQQYVESRFLMYSLRNLLTLLNEGARGVAQKGIYLRTLREIKICLPPLPEQKRIVEILDEVFEGIDKAIALSEQNLANARELFESYLNNIFTQKGDGWVQKELKKLTTKIGSGATPRGGKKSYKTEGISLIRSLNVYDRIFKEKDLAFIDDTQADKLSNVVVKEGDVLLNITGASIARSCVVPSQCLPARVNQHVTIIRPNQNEIVSKFLNYLITSKPYKEELLFTGDKAGATRQALTKTQIENFIIHFPDINKQNKIIKILDKLSAETQHLETIYQRKLEALQELKQSILQKAFTGELTTDTITKEVA
ncbi:MAG: restriction endonuclease subunit S [Crocosphaera sp.]